MLITYSGSKSFVVKSKRTDHHGCILRLDVTIDDTDYILINTYNANSEIEDIKVLNNLHFLLDSFDFR